ncbi:hypothetical protein O988_07074 [Pseudogymnoascus sp. VKM F-3808]|nr:hypothetical protein O988_07074 [Pseudogymnoascus sp. VKM F-3808]
MSSTQTNKPSITILTPGIEHQRHIAGHQLLFDTPNRNEHQTPTPYFLLQPKSTTLVPVPCPTGPKTTENPHIHPETPLHISTRELRFTYISRAQRDINPLSITTLEMLPLPELCRVWRDVWFEFGYKGSRDVRCRIAGVIAYEANTVHK